MSDKLVVYYSRTGATREIAGELAEYLECDIEEILSEKKYKGIFGWFAAGRGALRELTEDIAQAKYKPEDYDTVIVCSPVWAGKMPPAVRSYLNSKKDGIKKISYLLSMGGNTPEKPLGSFSNVGGEPVKTIYFSDSERKSAKWIDKLKAYADELD